MKTVSVMRESKETSVKARLKLEPGNSAISTGIGFLDHMIGSLATHAGWTLVLECRGDLEVDEHHSVEDCAITLGIALREAVADLDSMRRFGYAYAPLDEALARAVVDISGRPWCEADLGLKNRMTGTLSAENAVHFLWSLAFSAGITLHVDVLRGLNDHHRMEAAFKALALALKEALGSGGVAGSLAGKADETGAPALSTKGKVRLSIQREEQA